MLTCLRKREKTKTKPIFIHEIENSTGEEKDTGESHLDIFYSLIFLWIDIDFEQDMAGCLKAFQFQNQHESLISKYFPLKCELL